MDNFLIYVSTFNVLSKSFLKLVKKQAYLKPDQLITGKWKRTKKQTNQSHVIGPESNQSKAKTNSAASFDISEPGQN